METLAEGDDDRREDRVSLTALVLTQLFGAFSDNALKSAFGFILTYQGFSVFGLPDDIALTIGALLFVCPFFLISGFAGQIADRYDRVNIIKATRYAELALALVAVVAIQLQLGFLILLCVFFYSVQTAMFGPAKFGLIPQLARNERLVHWNAVLQCGTFSGILLGLFAGGLLAGNNLLTILCLVLVVAATASLFAALRIAGRSGHVNKAAAVSVRPGIYSGAKSSLSLVFSNLRFSWPALCISWFWTVGLILISVFPAIAKDLLNVTANTANLLIGTFVVGILLGAFAITRLLGQQVSTKFAAMACGLMAIGFAAFALSLPHQGQVTAGASEPIGVVDFFTSLDGLSIAFAMTALAAFAAIYVIPLYAYLQRAADNSNRARVHAGGAILDSAIATVVSIATVVAFASGLTFFGLLSAMAVASVTIAYLIKSRFPGQLGHSRVPVSS